MLKYIILGLRVICILLVTSGLMLFLAGHQIVRGKSIQTGFFYRRLWARATARILGLKIEPIHIQTYENTALYAGNHRSLTDPIIHILFFDAIIIAKAEVEHLPVVGKGADMTGIVFVKREKINSRVNARNQTQQLLEEGSNILVYPEGTTTASRTTGKFRIGTFKAASEAKVPIIPVAIEYRDKKDLWSGKDLFAQMLQQIGRWRTHVRISIGPPIDTKDPEEASNETKKWIDQELLYLQEGWSRAFS